MLFHTWVFLAFFVVTFVGYLTLRPTRLWLGWLLLASYVFYGFWKPYYLILIVYSTVLDYGAVRFMARCDTVRGKRIWLIVSIVNNLSLLCFFKYADFFIGNLNALSDAFALPFRLTSASAMMPFGWEYVLPVGISFYTFQSMSYTIDFYRGHLKEERNFIRFATYVSFFPQLVAGPIERATRLLPQFEKAPAVSLERFASGASLFLIGLFKKVALANYLAGYVDRVYSNPEAFDSAALILATFCFAWQIYFDFSGYTDMARGVARAMGFDLMINFRHPYLATGLGDFWARWHISLSTWFRDYVYIPLGGNKRGSWLTYRNLFIVFLISGFWHGANWTFVVWGLIHAFGVMGTRLFERSPWYRDQLPKWLKQAGTFVVVCLAWVFFRASSLEEALLIFQRIFTTGWTDPACPVWLLALVLSVWIYQWLSESDWRGWLDKPVVKVPLAIAMIVYLCFCSSGGGEFIYFQF